MSKRDLYEAKSIEYQDGQKEAMQRQVLIAISGPTDQVTTTASFTRTKSEAVETRVEPTTAVRVACRWRAIDKLTERRTAPRTPPFNLQVTTKAKLAKPPKIKQQRNFANR